VRPVSARFLAALRGSHRAVSQAFIVEPGQSGVDPVGTEIPIIGGDVRYDAKAQVRSTLVMETVGDFPDRASASTAPYGNEIFVRRGLDFGGGAIEWVSLGYFRIQSIEQDDAPTGLLRITANDRMQGIVDGRPFSPIRYGPTQPLGVVVESLVAPVWGWADIEWDDATDDELLGRALIVDEDRYAALDEVITSRGKIWYWDYRGILVIKDPPSTTSPVWSCDSGANGVLVQMSRELSREGVYNAVVATGEAFDAEAPAYAVVYDNDPDSPTYFNGGKFGRVPRYYSSPFLLTNAQAKSAAEKLLAQSIGLPYAIDFTNVPNPALEPWDPITVKVDDRSEVHIIDTLTIPLSVTQPQTGTTRVQQVVLPGEV